jgi:hypothetical protein
MDRSERRLASHSNAQYPGSQVLNRLRKKQVERIPMSYEQRKMLLCFFPYISYQVDL